MKKGIPEMLSLSLGGLAGYLVARHRYRSDMDAQIQRWRELSDKHLMLMKLYDKWMITKQDGRSVKEYFLDNHMKTVAIYGMGSVGERLQDELRRTGIEVRYGIDQKGQGRNDLDVVALDDDLGDVDVIVVTAVFYFDQIKEDIRKKTDIKVVSLQEVLDWIW